MATEKTKPSTTEATPKVTFLKHRLPAVNSQEYWQFRKAMATDKRTTDDGKGITHQDYTSTVASDALTNAATGNDVKAWLLERFDTDKVAALPAGSVDRQVLQYLGQLTERGWQRLTNAVLTKIKAKQ